MTERPRRTLAAPSQVYEGVGLHSGADAAVCFLPAPAGTGLTFRDRVGGQEIPARAVNVTDTSRCTRLGLNGLEVQTVEHVLSALAGLGVDDALIEFKGGEMPAGDGSAAPFVALIQEAGLQEHGDGISFLTFQTPMLIVEGSSTIIVMPADRFQVTVVLDYPDRSAIGTQGMTFDPAAGAYAQRYAEEIAPARTYGFRSELAMLHAHGLALGASYDNVLALSDSGALLADDDGRVMTPPRFLNELARHKLLDLIGDLALVGAPLQAHIIAVKPSHALNTRLARLLS